MLFVSFSSFSRCSSFFLLTSSSRAFLKKSDTFIPSLRAFLTNSFLTFVETVTFASKSSTYASTFLNDSLNYSSKLYI